MIPEEWHAAVTAAATQSLLIPTSSVPAVSPIPTVVPDQPHCQKIHATGARTLWVLFALMLLSSAVFTALSWSVPVSKRIFHILTTLVTIIATLTYFAMATGHGVSYRYIFIRERHSEVPNTNQRIFRQVFWARYIDWVVTTPLLILNLGILAGLSGAHILMAIVANIILVLTGFLSAWGHPGTGQKWGWFAIAILSYLVVVWHLAVNGRVVARARGDKVGKFFASIIVYTLLIWVAYPIVGAVADGDRKLSVDGTIIAFAILDIFAKPVFGFWLLGTLSRVPEANVEIGGFWAHGAEQEGSLRLRDDGA